MHDPDSTVRSNAARALAAIAVYAQKNPSSAIKLQAGSFVELLNSAVWTDRNNAAIALVTLTEAHDSELIKHLRDSALPSLVEMAKWKHAPHALSAYIVGPECGDQRRWTAIRLVQWRARTHHRAGDFFRNESKSAG